MRNFVFIWFGQLISTIGSRMTQFALTLWVWQLTGSATAIALLGFFSQLPSIFISLFAGVVVDRANRKHLMILGDTIAAISTLAIIILYFTGQLTMWHLYVAAAINGGFGQIQELAYSTSITLLVSPQYYTRATSMTSIVQYGASIIAPGLAGFIYPILGLGGILPIDLVTFTMAIVILLWIPIPQPPRDEEQKNGGASALRDKGKLEKIRIFWQEITFGIRYIWQNSSLRTLLIVTSLFNLFHHLGRAISKPMILARSGGDSQVLGTVSSAAGIGGVTGAVILSAWGGTKRRVNSLLAGFMGAGIAKIVFGLGQSLSIWIPAQFCSSLNFPLLNSSQTALWMEAIPPELQGRIFAANSLVLKSLMAISTLIAGLLSDRIFEPAMQSQTLLSYLFAPIFGTNPGAGMALLYVTRAIAMLLVGIIGYRLPQLRQLENKESG